MDVDDLRREAVDEIARQDLHVSCEYDEVDPHGLQQCDLARFLRLFVLLRDWNHLIVDAELARDRFEIRVVAHDERDLAVQFAGAVAQVPFVDVVTTMLDDSIPLTTGEYDEWGNPHERAAFDDICAYSPYDNVEAKDYPALLVLAGLHDSQVQYWEPAKWVAKLRALKTDANRLLLKTNMDAGHGGVSGRYRRYRETALQYAFLLSQAGLA